MWHGATVAFSFTTCLRNVWFRSIFREILLRRAQERVWHLQFVFYNSQLLHGMGISVLKLYAEIRTQLFAVNMPDTAHQRGS